MDSNLDEMIGEYEMIMAEKEKSNSMNLCISLSKINSFLNNPEENAYFLFFMERKRNIIHGWRILY